MHMWIKTGTSLLSSHSRIEGAEGGKDARAKAQTHTPEMRLPLPSQPVCACVKVTGLILLLLLPPSSGAYGLASASAIVCVLERELIWPCTKGGILSLSLSLYRKTISIENNDHCCTQHKKCEVVVFLPVLRMAEGGTYA